MYRTFKIFLIAWKTSCISAVKKTLMTDYGRSGTYRGNNRLDSNSNLTVDFGFYKPMSIGNRVWLDTDGDGIRDDG